MLYIAPHDILATPHVNNLAAVHKNTH